MQKCENYSRRRVCAFCGNRHGENQQDPFKCLATIHQHLRETDRHTQSTG